MLIQYIIGVNMLIINQFSAGIDFRRQIVTSNVDPRTDIGIQMKRKELPWPVMLI